LRRLFVGGNWSRVCSNSSAETKIATELMSSMVRFSLSLKFCGKLFNCNRVLRCSSVRVISPLFISLLY